MVDSEQALIAVATAPAFDELICVALATKRMRALRVRRALKHQDVPALKPSFWLNPIDSRGEECCCQATLSQRRGNAAVLRNVWGSKGHYPKAYSAACHITHCPIKGNLDVVPLRVHVVESRHAINLSVVVLIVHVVARGC